MAGVHDIGGRDGFGPVPVDDDNLFTHDWERRAFAVTQFSQVAAGFNTDAFRHGIEREDPDLYRAATYFEKWIRNAERMLVEGGVIPADAVTARTQGREPAATAERTTDAAPPRARGAARATDAVPRFAVGERVRVVAPAPGAGHTRLPDYVTSHIGTVALVNGSWVFPDSHAHGRGENPCWVYAVRFAASDLWPDADADRGPVEHQVHVDLFEPYLEPA